MTKVIRSADCGNSPKNRLVENLAVALATGDLRAVSGLVAGDVEWTVVGGGVFRGREAVLQALERVGGDSILKLIVRHVVTHGKSGAVDGTVHDRVRQRQGDERQPNHLVPDRSRSARRGSASTFLRTRGFSVPSSTSSTERLSIREIVRSIPAKSRSDGRRVSSKAANRPISWNNRAPLFVSCS